MRLENLYIKAIICHCSWWSGWTHLFICLNSRQTKTLQKIIFRVKFNCVHEWQAFKQRCTVCLPIWRTEKVQYWVSDQSDKSNKWRHHWRDFWCLKQRCNYYIFLFLSKLHGRRHLKYFKALISLLIVKMPKKGYQSKLFSHLAFFQGYPRHFQEFTAI